MFIQISIICTQFRQIKNCRFRKRDDITQEEYWHINGKAIDVSDKTMYDYEFMNCIVLDW